MKTTTEIALACAGMSRKQANEIVNHLLEKFENHLSDAPIGKSYSQCYNLDDGTVRDEYLQFVHDMKKELSPLGINTL